MSMCHRTLPWVLCVFGLGSHVRGAETIQMVWPLAEGAAADLAAGPAASEMALDEEGEPRGSDVVRVWISQGVSEDSLQRAGLEGDLDASDAEAIVGDVLKWTIPDADRAVGTADSDAALAADAEGSEALQLSGKIADYDMGTQTVSGDLDKGEKFYMTRRGGATFTFLDAGNRTFTITQSEETGGRAVIREHVPIEGIDLEADDDGSAREEEEGEPEARGGPDDAEWLDAWAKRLEQRGPVGQRRARLLKRLAESLRQRAGRGAPAPDWQSGAPGFRDRGVGAARADRPSPPVAYQDDPPTGAAPIPTTPPGDSTFDEFPLGTGGGDYEAPAPPGSSGPGAGVRPDVRARFVAHAADADADADSDADIIEADSSDSRIDVLIVYTNRATRSAGGRAALEAVIQNAIRRGNEAFRNSRVPSGQSPATFNVVGFVEATGPNFGGAYPEVNPRNGVESFERMLKQLRFRRGQSDPNGLLDHVHTLRRDTRADLVSLIVDSEPPTGQGRLFGLAFRPDPPLSSGHSAQGFSVVSLGSSFANITLAHEMCHNLTCIHVERPDLNGGRARSVMAKGPASVPRVPQFDRRSVDRLRTAVGTASQFNGR